MKNFKYTLLFFFLSLQYVGAQTQFAKDFSPFLNKSFELTLDVAEAMPEEQYAFKPEEGAMTFGEQLIHCTYVADAIIDIFLKGNSDRKFEAPDAKIMTKSEIIAAIKGFQINAVAILNEFSEEELAEKVNLFGQIDTFKKEAFYFVRDHITNHRAKANLYVRISGNKPAAYGYF
jgi:uncharacterized damage-inducible protein DinB